MNIVVSDPLPASALDVLRDEPGWTLVETDGRDRASLLARVAEADALIVRSATQVDAELLRVGSRLRVVARAGTGVDNVDVAEATSRGVLVLNAPGANSISVAEHAFALMLALARRIPSADAAMKAGKWEKKRLTGGELRAKTLGIIGLGRIGQELAARAHAFGMHVVAHDPYIPPATAAALEVPLLSLDDLCRTSDYISLHVPSSAATRHMMNAERLASCKPGVRIINTARGDLIDDRALADAIERGHVSAAGLDVFNEEPPRDWRLVSLPQVIATPHLAGSTEEAQEQVGIETAEAVRAYLLHGTVRTAVNFPALSPDEASRLQPLLVVAQRLGEFAVQALDAAPESITVTGYGDVPDRAEVVADAAVAGVLGRVVSGGVTIVNARAIANERGLEIIASRSSRPRNFTASISVTVRSATKELCVSGAPFESGPRIVQVDDVAVEAALEGSMILVRNMDQPGVIGRVGTILGERGINIASFTLGRSRGGAVGIVNLDDSEAGGAAELVTPSLLEEIRRVPGVRDARAIQTARRK